MDVSLLPTPRTIGTIFMEEVKHLAKRCAQQTQIIKKQNVDLKQHKESTVHASEEVSGLKAESERDNLTKEKAKIEEELKSQLEHRESVGVERGLRMDRTDEEFRGLSQRVAGFIPNAKEKFDRVIATFPNTTFPFLDKVSQNSQSSLQDIARLEPDRVTSSHQTSFATASLRVNTHV
ncbi:hypothetical protein Tco_0585394 [Tanacetum coccineum]